MHKAANHIISSFRWHTIFDQKERAPELQQRLSRWSRTMLQKEITTVFDKLCPPGQVWRIQSLELDLGLIDFNELEFELALKLKRQLREKLSDLIVYGDKSNDHSIEILSEDVSQLGQIRFFLLHGILSWNQQPVQASISEMLSLQLQYNSHAVVGMIREIGVPYEQARKRIAWQVKEPVIAKIIKGLEPNNYTQVIDFSNELTAIHSKKNIVQANTGDFKKNLWYWILNHLLVERGTVFNKVMFMKSSIRQMAQHYNISYDQLFDQIELAASKLDNSIIAKSDFVLTLRILSEEHKTGKERAEIADEKETDWLARLDDMLHDHAMRKSGTQRSVFNDLILSLARSDGSGLQNLVSKSGHLWQSVVDDLNEHSINAIFSAFSPARSALLVETIYFLEGLSRETSFPIEKKTLWETGLNFLGAKRNSAFDNKTFLEYCLSDISRRSKLDEQQVLYQLIHARIQPFTKTIATLGIYKNLIAIFSAKTAKGSIFLQDRLTEMLDQFAEHSSTTGINNDLSRTLQQSIGKNIRLSPVMSLQMLIRYHDKKILRRIMPHILNDQTTLLLVKHSQKEIASLLLSFKRILSRYEKDNAAARFMNDNLLKLGLEAIIFHPQSGQAQLLEIIVRELYYRIPASSASQLGSFIDQVFSNKRSKSWDISALLGKMPVIHSSARMPVIERVRQLMYASPANQPAIGKILAANFTDPDFTNWRASKTKDGRALLRYMLKEGEALMDTLVPEYTDFVSKKIAPSPNEKFSSILDELFWKCIVSYTDYEGEPARFRRSFAKTVRQVFPAAGKRMIAATSREKVPATNDNYYYVKNGYRLSYHELFSLIEQGLAGDLAIITHKGIQFQLNDLLETGLSEQPAAFRKILSKMPVSDNVIRTMKQSVSFDRFSSFISDEENAGMEEIRGLYELVEQLAPASPQDNWDQDYWKQSWELMKTNRWSMENSKKLMQDSFHKLAMETGLKSEDIVAAIREKNISLAPAIKNILVQEIPAIADLEVDEAPDDKLCLLEQKGLLDPFIYWLISQRQIPSWFDEPHEQDVKYWLNAILLHYPRRLLFELRRKTIDSSQIDWLRKSLNFGGLIDAIGRLQRSQRHVLDILRHLYNSFTDNLPGFISREEIQAAIFRKIINAWVNNNWRIISIENIWNELAWDICMKKGISIEDFMHDIRQRKAAFLPSLQVSLESLANHDKKAIESAGTKAPSSKAKPLLKQEKKSSLPKTGIAVRNAGLVLVNHYIAVLFERLGLVRDKIFTDTQAQCDAAHYLQFVATGSSHTEESYLVLNKVLCGIPLSEPLKDGIDISESNQKLIESLLQAVIGHWPSIGDTSVDGFRGNWLVRDGLLSEQPDKWELTVEKRAYDLLINRSPFSFSIIKYPWMEKPLHVYWSY